MMKQLRQESVQTNILEGDFAEKNEDECGYDDELLGYLEKSAKVIQHYSKENYDLRQEIDVHKQVKGIMAEDYKNLQRKLYLIEQNNNRKKEKGSGLIATLAKLGESVNDEYKKESAKTFEKMKENELEQWEKYKTMSIKL